MAITEILPGIHYVGVNDRTTTRFEALWSLPMGVSYNAYLVCGERTALSIRSTPASRAVCWPTSANGWATDRWIIW